LPQSGFPTATLTILIATFLTSFRAFRDQLLYERCILNPWSVVQHKIRYYTLISNGLIHTDPIHLTINMMSFTFFALPLEGIIGHFQFVLVYLGSLIFSSIVITVKNGNNAYYRCLGASGAVSGVIFSYILYRPNAQISMMIAPVGVPAPIFALAYVAYSYFMSKSKCDNVAHDAHLWGAFAGALITLVLDPNLVGTAAKMLH
jgi:membrane associated rhomboid family serine protease